jgi:thiol-disulfide isomerase/thioredoxin
MVAWWRGVGLALLAGALGAAQPGDALPDWSDHELEGEVPDLAGKVVLVEVWASWCGPCKASFPAYTALQEEWRERGFVIVAVSVDRAARAYKRFLQQNEPGFTTVRDARQTLVATLKPPAMPTCYLYGRDGTLRAVHQGYRGASTIEELRAQIEPLLEETP